MNAHIITSVFHSSLFYAIVVIFFCSFSVLLIINWNPIAQSCMDQGGDLFALYCPSPDGSDSAVPELP